MSTVQEIERAIEKLSDEELAEVRAWLWDRDIERDADSGRLDALAEEALQEYRSGKTTRLWCGAWTERTVARLPCGSRRVERVAVSGFDPWVQ